MYICISNIKLMFDSCNCRENKEKRGEKFLGELEKVVNVGVLHRLVALFVFCFLLLPPPLYCSYYYSYSYSQCHSHYYITVP